MFTSDGFRAGCAGRDDVHGDVHRLLLRVTHSVDAVDRPALDRQVDRPKKTGSFSLVGTMDTLYVATGTTSSSDSPLAMLAKST